MYFVCRNYHSIWVIGPGLGQSQAQPSQNFGFWPGLWFYKAQAAQSQAKAGAFRPSRSRHITNWCLNGPQRAKKNLRSIFFFEPPAATNQPGSGSAFWSRNPLATNLIAVSVKSIVFRRLSQRLADKPSTHYYKSHLSPGRHWGFRIAEFRIDRVSGGVTAFCAE